MARALRIQPVGGFLHVTARGNRRQPIYLDGRDYERYLALLGAVARRCGWRIHAYCLLPNHVHLLIELSAESLSAGMQYLHGQYAQYFNRRHCLDGHVFQGRFHSVLVQSHAHLGELCRYIPLNAWRAGLCAQPGDWPWSSLAPAAVGPDAPVLSGGLVRDLFGERAAYERFLAEAPPPRSRDGPRGKP